MTLMILAHPASQTSIANKAVIESLRQADVVLEVRDIGQLYPDHQIDVKKEQQALLHHDVVILQHPLYWYNMPAIMKSWMDQILTYQFAYGSQGDKLKGKKLIQSVTVGQTALEIQESVQELSSLVQATANYSQMDFVGTLALYDISTVTGNSPESIQLKAAHHGKALYQMIKNIER